MLKVKDVQEILGIGKKQAYEFIGEVEYRIKYNKDYPFPVKRIGRSIRIPKDPFFDWLKQGD